MFCAAELGHTSCVNVLLSKGADVKMAAGGFTPLMMASYAGKLDCERMLIECGSDVEASDEVR